MNCMWQEGGGEEKQNKGKQGFKSSSLHVLAPPHTIILMTMMM